MTRGPCDLADALPSEAVRPVRIDGLHDIVLEPADDGGLARPGGDGTSLTARELAELVRRGGGADADVRVLMPDGGHFLTLLGATAKELGRDVLVVPAGADPRRMPSSGGLHDDAWGAPPDEVVPIDRTSGYPVDWLVVQPADQASSLPGWFDLVGGLVLARTGTVSVPLPGGLVLATRTDFVARRAAAARLGSGHPALVTVAVTIRDGRFLVGDYSGAAVSHDGQSLAAVLSTTPLYGCDLRLWFTWPDTVDDQRRLRTNIHALAEITGAVVWTPPPGGRAEIVDGCRDIGALDAAGQVGGWVSFQPPPRTTPRFESDHDGRLVPAGGFVVESYPGVPVVSVAASRARDMASHYQRIRARAGTFVADLAVLDDGRLAGRAADGTLMALGPRQMSALLENAGWRGTDIALLCEVSPERVDGLRRCVEIFSATLGCAISVATPGALTAGPPPSGPARSGAPRSVLTTPGLARPGQLGSGAPAQPDPARRQLPEATVAQVLAALDPNEADDAALATELSVAVAEYLVVEQRIALATTPDGRDIEIRARLRKAIERIVSPALARLPVPIPSAPVPPAPVLVELAVLEPAVIGPTVPEPAVVDPAVPEAAVGESAVVGAEPAPAERAAPVVPTGSAEPPELSPRPESSLVRVAAPAPDRAESAAAEVDPPTVVLERPAMTTAAKGSAPHGVRWLPEHPRVNAETIELYVPLTTEPERAVVEGVRSPELFLLGRLDRRQPDTQRTGGYAVKVRVGPGGAVDVTASGARPPQELQHLLSWTDMFVLPAGWLDRSQAVAGYRVEADGQVHELSELPSVPLTILSDAARHGVSGLPNDVERWPRSRLRAATTAYGIVPDQASGDLPDWIEIVRRRPKPRAGVRLVAINIADGRAIDVVATHERLAPLTAVRTEVATLRQRGVDLILPRRSYGRVRVTHGWEPDGDSWRRLPAGSVALE